MSSITFATLDDDLQVKLYQFCLPSMQKKLYLSSKKISELGQKPNTFIVKDICFRDDDAVPEDVYELKNAVIDVRRSLGLEKIGMVDMAKMVQYFEFNHTYFGIWHSQVDKNLMKYFANPRIVGCDVDYTLSFVYVLRIMPTVEYLTYRDILPRQWEQKLLKWKQRAKLKRFCLYPSEINDFHALWNFINRQTSEFEMVLEEGNFDEDELFQYFSPLKGNERGKKRVLCIKSSNESPEINVTPKIIH